jgi:hypothetical protein
VNRKKMQEEELQTGAIDAYEKFFEVLPKERFIDFGLENIISIDSVAAASEWLNLCSRIETKAPDLFVRNSGRNGNGNAYLSQLYMEMFGISINYDPTNNAQPTKLIEKLTGHRKNKTIFNYQVSHVFGRTKNVYSFAAPWNIVFIPKIVDPLTGHEAKGDFVDEFTCSFRKRIYSKFTKEIEEFNSKMLSHQQKIHEWVMQVIPEKERGNYLKEFAVIRI